MSTVNTPTGISAPPKLSYASPKAAPWRRINWRIAIFAAVVLTIIGVPFYIWANEVITGGVHNYGSYKEVNLKAMSSFDMDQTNAVMEDIPGQFRAIDGQEVMMQGEMWAPTYAGDEQISYFQLVYSKTKCCFSGPPLAQHFVDGFVTDKAKVYMYDNVPVKVWGKLHVYIRKDAGGTIKSIYHVDVTKVEPIQS
jgi:hypothetical protein